MMLVVTASVFWLETGYCWLLLPLFFGVKLGWVWSSFAYSILGMWHFSYVLKNMGFWLLDCGLWPFRWSHFHC